MDMVNNQIPTFEDKAEALHYFPMWRTWFGLNGLCKLPWNDVEPTATNAESDEAAKVPEHVQNYVELFAGVTGREVDRRRPDRDVGARLQLPAGLQPAHGLRRCASTTPSPTARLGPVTEEEYESRQERYDGQLREWLGLDPART